MLDDALTQVLGRPPRISFANADKIIVPNVYSNPDIQEISKELRERIDSGEDSVETLTDWRRHLFAVTYGLPKEGFCPQGRCPFHPEQENKSPENPRS